MTKSQWNRRTFLKTTLASSTFIAGLGKGMSFAAGHTANPFNLATGSTVDAVIFNGGYGYDYVEFAGAIVEGNHDGVDVVVSPSTQIAQELQPRFIAGTPPDLIDNSGAGRINFTAIADQLEDLSDVIAAPNLEGQTIADTLLGGALTPGTYDGRLIAINYVLTVYAMWYSASLFEENGWTPPKTWAEAKELGAKAKEKDIYLFGWGKEAVTYYLNAIICSAIKEGGHDVRLGLENLTPDCWSHPAMQSVLTEVHDIIAAGYVKPGGAGTQFTAAQAQWSNEQAFLIYPSGAWIENEMKAVTKEGFRMTGMPVPTVSENSALPLTSLQSTADEAFIVPSNAANVAGGKEVLRAMLSKEAAQNFVKTRLAPTIVEGSIPEDGFGSTALQSQGKLLSDAGQDVFSWNFINLYGMDGDFNVQWNLFMDGKLSVDELTAAMQAITDRVANDDSIVKATVE